MTEETINAAMWEELEISNDFIFGKVMQDPELCRKLLQRILPDLTIDHVEYPEAQKNIRPDVDAKSVRLDLYVIDGKGTVYDIEMQVAGAKDLPKRTRYYQSLIDMQMIDKGEPYRKLNPSYVIFICPFDLFGKGRHIYTFENVCREDKEIFLEDGTAKIFLNALGDKDDVSAELKAFLDYVAGKRPKDPFVEELDDAVKKARKNREWRREYMTLLMRDQENIEKGVKRGMEIGAAQGIVETGLDCGLSEDDILSRLQIKLSLSYKSAREYFEKFGKQTV